MVTPKKSADAPEFGIQHNCKGKLHRRKLPASAFGKRKRRAFLEHLAHSSNVTASSKAAGISASTVYRTRDNDPGFAADWRAALASGYELLEMELLHRARFGSDTTELDADYKMRKIVHSFSDTLGVRLLAMHRETVNAHRLEAAGDGWVTQGLARWYPGATLVVDLDRVTELASDREMLWKMVDGAGFLTLAEKREMVGLEDPAAGGTPYWVSPHQAVAQMSVRGHPIRCPRHSPQAIRPRPKSNTTPTTTPPPGRSAAGRAVVAQCPIWRQAFLR